MGVVHRRSGDGPAWEWNDVAVDTYDGNGHNAGHTRQVLIGARDGAPNFAIRYFTLAAHGCSALDYHEHDHGVVVVNGHGRVLLGDHWELISAGDAVYIPSFERHQFENLGDDLFTFLCVVPPKKEQPAEQEQPDMCLLPGKPVQQD